MSERQRGIDRRRLLIGGLGVVGGVGLFSRPSAARAPLRRILYGASNAGSGGASNGARNLVLVQLSGGNDGLSTVVPYADDAYHRSRTTTRIAPRDALAIDTYRGFHPNLSGLRGLFEQGRLAVVEGCGYPRPNRSHFKSFEIWHTARAEGRASGDGWIGRLCAAAFGDESAPSRVVHVGERVPYSLHSITHPPASFVVPEGYRWVGNEDEVEAYGRSERGKVSPSLAHLRSMLEDALSSSTAVRAAAARYRPTVTYPDDAFGSDLRTAAALINGDLGARVISVELHGFDTHAAQRSRHDALMRRLDQGLTAFLADLENSDVGRNTVVLAFSEFGRRVEENASRGTDHGTAGPMLVAGHQARGGLHGKHPSLEALEDGDLVFTTDFRSVYGTLIEASFGVQHEAVLGARYPLLDLVG